MWVNFISQPFLILTFLVEQIYKAVSPKYQSIALGHIEPGSTARMGTRYTTALADTDMVAIRLSEVWVGDQTQKNILEVSRFLFCIQTLF
jgi:hypothetical protein